MAEILTREEYEGLLETLDAASVDNPDGEVAGNRLLAYYDAVATALAAKDAEIERLREALAKIASKSGPKFHWDLKEIARAALAERKETK